MYEIKIEMETEQPLIIKNNKESSNLIRTMDYIPGSQLRGKTAARLDDNRKIFSDIIFSNRVRFHNSYYQDGREIPFTALSCKYYPGFSKDNEKNHQVYDILIKRLNDKEEDLARCKEMINDDDIILGGEEISEHCEGVMKQYNGFYTREENKFHSVKVEKDIIEKTSITNKNGTSKDGSLFLQEYITPGQIYRGTISILEGNKKIRDQLVTLFENQSWEYFGSARSRGNGKMKIVSVDSREFTLEEEKNRIKQKYKLFNSIINSSLPDNCFSLTLTSDTIVHDELLNYKKKLEIVDIINHSTRLTEEEKEALRCFSLLTKEGEEIFYADSRSIFGWNGLNNLPKPVETGISSGSVFVYGANEVQNQELFFSALAKISLYGIGLRRNEGYGCVRVNDEFHYKAREGL